MSKLSQIEAPLVRNRFMDREMEAYIKKWDDSQRLDDPHALEELFQDKYMMSNRETNSSIPEEKSGAEVDIQAELARYINECEALKLYIKMTDQRTCEQKRRWENEKQQYEGALQLASQKFNRERKQWEHEIQLCQKQLSVNQAELRKVCENSRVEKIHIVIFFSVLFVTNTLVCYFTSV
ncbi:hypothetical protein TWF569_000243 [Orbilia oligospora]|nr:hypothetical protein TWF751_002924 [Orbilia oligospora]KAF3157678.1 hypothetical protein TWF569_000243 [Orbilia oligospora]